MRLMRAVGLFVVLLAIAARPLTDREVKKIIEHERAARADLPKAFATSAWTVRRDGTP